MLQVKLTISYHQYYLLVLIIATILALNQIVVKTWRQILFFSIMLNIKIKRKLTSSIIKVIKSPSILIIIS